MKKFLPLLLYFSVFSCCEDDDITPQPPSCEEIPCEIEEEFFGKAIMNGECWTADWNLFLKQESGTSAIYLFQDRADGIEEGLTIRINSNANLLDTLWIGRTGEQTSNLARVYYSYRESHSLVGEFDFELGSELTYKDYLIIDYFNADTSIIEGHFQVNFPKRSVSNFANAPDSMRLECGSFRVKRQ